MAQHWFVTGVGSGLGRHIAEQLLARGDRVAGTVRQPDALDDLARVHGDRLWLARLELTDAPAIRRVVDDAFAALGRIDVVVNNAGYGLFGAAEEFDDDQVRHQLETNLVGSIRVVRAALPHLRAQGGGRLIQVSSAAGQASYPGASLYQASKWGIEGFMEATAQDLAPLGIGVTIVEPGGARTGFGATGARLGTPIEAYRTSPAGRIGRALKDPALSPRGDPARMAQAILASADQHPAPRRLVLGSDSWAVMRAALVGRLAELEAQRDLATSTDFPAEPTPAQ